MSDANTARARELHDEALAKLAAAARSFTVRVQSQAGVEPRQLIDEDGEAVSGLVDVERAPGAAALALPLDLILFETWVLGHLGDRDELDLDVNTHREVWFGLGAWIGETLRARHGGSWLIGSDDPRTWRLGFSKILLEIGPHVFAEKLLRAGQGLGRRLVAEIERLRQLHAEQAQKDGGEARDRYTVNHYARIHSVPLGQWMIIDVARVHALWGQQPAETLLATMTEAKQKVPIETAPVFERLLEAIGKLDPKKPAHGQAGADRALYEAVAQILGMRRATPPIAIDHLEQIVLPALHVGMPDKFPPLADDDVANIGRGADLYSVFIDTVPYTFPAEEKGFLGTFGPKELSTPYADRANLELGRGDWIAVNPARLVRMLESFDPKRAYAVFEKFIDYVERDPAVPRVREPGRAVAQSTMRALTDLKACLGALGKGCALVFRLLPPPL